MPLEWLYSFQLCFPQVPFQERLNQPTYARQQQTLCRTLQVLESYRPLSPTWADVGSPSAHEELSESHFLTEGDATIALSHQPSLKPKYRWSPEGYKCAGAKERGRGGLLRHFSFPRWPCGLIFTLHYGKGAILNYMTCDPTLLRIPSMLGCRF